MNGTCGAESSLAQTSSHATVMPGMLTLSLCAVLVISSFAPIEIMTIVMFAGGMLLLADPYAGTRRARDLLFPGAGYLGIILAIGIAGASGKAPYDILKDIWYVGNAALTILFGYLLAQRMNSLRDILRGFVAAAAIVSAVHIGRFILNPAYLSETVLDLRVQAGAGYLITAIGAVILLGDARFRVGVLRNRMLSRVIAMVCLVSVLLSFSRTLWVVLLTGVLTATLTTRIKVVFRVGAVAAVLLLIVIAGASLDDADTLMPATFIDKLAQIPQELKVTSYDTFEDINVHWRGYETYRALLTYMSGGMRGYLLGGGFGTNVDLGFVMTLADEEFSEIPILHNGYMYLLVKTGAVGLAAYGVFLLSTFRTGMRLTQLSDVPMKYCGLLLVALTFIMLESTLVVAGMFNKYWLYPATLLMGMLLGHSTMMNSGPKKDAL